MTRAWVHGEPIAGALLAGGLSRRMGGGDKCLRLLGGAPLLWHALSRLHTQTDAVVLNANGDPARFMEFGLPIVADTIAGYAGPLAGVLAGMTWARQNFPEARYLATAASDTPFFPPSMVGALYASVIERGGKIAIAACGGRVHPTFGLWPVDLAEQLEAALASGQRKALDWVTEHNGVSVDFALSQTGDVEFDPFFNINTQDELAEAERIWGYPARRLRFRGRPTGG